MSPRRVVLVGAGHAHVEVLRRWATRPPPGAHLTLIEPRSVAVYSGMVPGFVAGDYTRDEIGIEVGPLAVRAGAEWIASSARRIDRSTRLLRLDDGREIAWDLASLDIGSTVKGLDLPGVREHALATRPIADFVEEIDAWIARRRDGLARPPADTDAACADGTDTSEIEAAAASRPARIAVVGGGAAGVELAFTLSARLDRCPSPRSGRCDGPRSGRCDGPRSGRSDSPRSGRSDEPRGGLCDEPRGGERDQAATVLLVAESAMLAGYPDRARRLLRREATSRRIGLVEHARVVRVEGGGVVLDDGRRLDADLVVWAAGAAAHPLPAESALPTDDAGFVRTRPTLQVERCDDLFAAGDCAAIDGAVKAGVHAVRSGPVLDANLRARLDGRPLEAFRPQRDFLSLLNLGGQRALATKWGLVLTGASMWKLKDWIDRRFLRRYAAAGES